VSDRDGGVVLFDQLIEVQGRAADGGVVLDLAVERVFALQRAVAVDHPDDVIGQAKPRFLGEGTTSVMPGAVRRP
jgi:hypothetical protein